MSRSWSRSEVKINVEYGAFSRTWPAATLDYWNKSKCLHKNGVQIPEDKFGTPSWPPFLCFGTPTWPRWRHVKTLYCGKICCGWRTTFWPLWWQLSLSIRVQTTLNHIRFVKYRRIKDTESTHIPGSDVQFTSVYNTREFKENWEPAFDPDLIGFWNAAILATVFSEHLLH